MAEFQKATLQTYPTTVGSPFFHLSKPHSRVLSIVTKDEKIDLPTPLLHREPLEELVFDLPKTMIDGLGWYVRSYYRTRRIRNCTNFMLAMTNPSIQQAIDGEGAENLEINSYVQSLYQLNASIGDRVEDKDSLRPNTPLLVAHPGYRYTEMNGLSVDHALVSLNGTYGVQVMGLSGHLAVTTYDYIVNEYQVRMPQFGIWEDGRVPTADEIGLHYVAQTAE
jgi:hypothetical protein